MAPTPPVPLKTDPNVQIPPAVAAAAARALELQQQIYGDPEAPPPAPAEPVAPPPEPTPAPVPQPTPPPPPAAVEADEESWEKRYKAMKGRYDKSLTQIEALSTEVSNVRNVLATMEARPVTPAGNGATAPKPKKLITEQEEQDYGEEFFSVVEKKARELIEPMQEQYEERIKGLETQIKGVGSQVVQTSVARMEAQLDGEVPTWRAVNADWENNGFKEWLQLPDPYSGAIRHNLLNTAYERCDTPRVAAFFKGFHAEVAATAPDQGDGSNLAPVTTAPRVPLAALAAPGRAKSAAQSLPAEKPIITRAQISQFYVDCSAGRYRGREAERAENERMIFEAQREGRIR